MSPAGGLHWKEKVIVVPQTDSFTGWAQSQSSTKVILCKMDSHLVHKTRKVKEIKIHWGRESGMILVKKIPYELALNAEIHPL